MVFGVWNLERFRYLYFHYHLKINKITRAILYVKMADKIDPKMGFSVIPVLYYLFSIIKDVAHYDNLKYGEDIHAIQGLVYIY